ncbi:DUF1911 domain-containing protein [Curtobacterium sp. MCLR17_036]|uniref:PoNe immunity protein domain-containing protein n=1 Tax=Curtobacterium sp. MCLR17_036 TaxID=2175620 RepID=UPI0015E8AFD9|nr:PoNe immunity protein domain-containing protein [Curtobacterium sp. MCLR17_036]WIE65762.1 DUF1911 domain-containing protein [Curtobacterium sp. MCLR17_036]
MKSLSPKTGSEKKALRPRAREIDERYWRSALDVTSTNWEGRKSAFARAVEPERRTKGARDSWHTGLKYLAVQYSAGIGLAEIGAAVGSVAESYSTWVELAIDLPDRSPSLSEGNDYYVSVLRLLGLAVGSSRSDSAALILDAVSRQGADALFDGLSARLGGRHRVGDVEVSTPRLARPLVVALDQPSSAPQQLRKYLQDWPSRMKPLSWMGSLDHVRPGDEYGEGFVGYWAFEVPAIVRAADVDFDGVESPFLPNDLL